MRKRRRRRRTIFHCTKVHPGGRKERGGRERETERERDCHSRGSRASVEEEAISSKKSKG
jgi:hypothetical protein